jgi:hypothetical protein
MLRDLRGVGCERTLMFDPEAQELLEMLPAAVRDRGLFAARLVRRLWPPAARVADANSLVPLSFPPVAHKLARWARPKLGKLRRALIENSYQTTASWPLRSLLYTGDPQWREVIEANILAGDHLPDDVFEPDAVRSCWRDLCDGNFEREADVDRLMTLAGLSHTSTRLAPE